MLYCIAFKTLSSNMKISGYLGVNLRTDSNSYWWKPNTQSTSLCLEWSQAMVTLCLHLSPLMASDSTQGTNIKHLEEVVLPWIERVAAGRLYIWQHDSVPCYTSRRTWYWLSENFSDHITPNIWLCNSSDCNSPWLLCMGHSWTRDQQNSIQHQRWTDSKDNGNIYQFKQGDC